MSAIQITSVSGETPFDIFVSDIYGISTVFVGSIISSESSTQIFDLPSIFDDAPAVILKLIGGNDCQLSRFLLCNEITYLEGSNINITIILN
jgi:hypothetical protein